MVPSAATCNSIVDCSSFSHRPLKSRPDKARRGSAWQTVRHVVAFCKLQRYARFGESLPDSFSLGPVEPATLVSPRGLRLPLALS